MKKLAIFVIINFVITSALGQQVMLLSFDYQQNPVSMDNVHPRLSWQTVSTKQNQQQYAYQILVASKKSLLIKNTGDIWDSGKKISSQSNFIMYRGKLLQSAEKYYWKVRIWDQANKVSPWSSVSFWQMGLLRPKDWKASWITASKWYTPIAFRPKGFQLGQKGGWADIDLKHTLPIDSFRLWPLNKASFPSRFRITGANEFNFIHEQVLVDFSRKDYLCKQATAQTFQSTAAKYRFIRLQIFGNKTKKDAIVRQLEVFSGGRNIALMKFTREYGTAWDHGHAPYLVDGMPSQQDGDRCPDDACATTAAPLLRKQFQVKKKIKQALLYYAALGMADVTINGKRVGDEVLGPPFTDYYKRIMYVTYDVTHLLSQGENVIGITLANGFFSTPSLGFGQRQNGNGPPQVKLQTVITYTDGTHEIIGTDQGWKWSKGEITFNDVWEGYSEDRNLSKPGWNFPQYQDQDWKPVKVTNGLPGKLIARFGPSNRINAIIKPDSIKGNHVYFKTASVGWPLLKINGKAGQTITISGIGPGYRVAPLSFKLAADGPATLSPRFIIQPGATDMMIDGLREPLSSNDIVIQSVNAALNNVADFECSNPFLNNLYGVTMRTHRNYINDFPADPNREKQGWTQDVQNMFSTAAYFTDVKDLYWRWWNDMKDNQDEQGYLGSVIPMVNRQVYDWNSPWWSGMIVFLPWQHYQYYGDKHVLEEAYPNMKKYVTFLNRMAQTGEGRNWDDYPYFNQNLDTAAAKEQMIIWNGAGDWNNPYTKTQHAVPTPVTTMTAWYHYADVLSKTAHILGRRSDEKKYALLAWKIKDRFNLKYFHPENGLYGDSTNSQTAQVLPLAVGMVPGDKFSLTYQRLLDAIHSRGDHVGTGFTATSYLLQILATYRESGLANKMINQQDYPGWNTLIQGGVLQEDWHGNGAQMPSCGGAVGAWLFQSVLGVQPDEMHPGFKEFILSPQPDKQTNLYAARGYYISPYGKISVNWVCEGGKFKLDVTIPFNTKAKVLLPSDQAELKSSIGGRLQPVDPTLHATHRDGLLIFTLGSGKYHFESIYNNR